MKKETKVMTEIVGIKPYEVFKTPINGELVEIVMVTTEQYNKLNRDQDFLLCLQGCGVDNWEGYGDAVEMFEEGI